MHASIASLAVGLACLAMAADAPVSIDIFMDEALPASSAQEWVRRLGEQGLDNVKIRQQRADDKVAVENIGTAQSPRFHATGKLTAKGILELPRAKFAPSEAARLKRYMADLAKGGTEPLTDARGPFGLLPSQWKRIQADLAKTYGESTAGKPAAEVARQIGRQLDVPVTFDPDATQALDDLTVMEELQGIARGTALAVVLRPAGLAFAPQAGDGGELAYRVAQGETLMEIWPIGREPNTPPRETLPAIVETINVEIAQAPLADVLNTLSQRLEAPFWYDHNAIVRHGADVQREVSLPAGRLMYAQILRKLLAQARMKYELRMDDAGKPFLWITTIKPLRPTKPPGSP